MGDPRETLAADGTIRTGAARHRIVRRYRPVLDAAVEHISGEHPEASVYVYGSVATGQARPPHSDVDVLTIGLPTDRAVELSSRLSTTYADLCRSVDIAAAQPSDLDGDGDEAYGWRLFVHHYCVHLAGPDRDRAVAAFPGDRRAARGLDGDIAILTRRWRDELHDADATNDADATDTTNDADATDATNDADATDLARRVARRTLLAVACLVSVHDGSWTTDRERAARRWAQIEPRLAAGLAELTRWSALHPDEAPRTVDRRRLEHRLGTTVDAIVSQFATRIGLWPD